VIALALEKCRTVPVLVICTGGGTMEVEEDSKTVIKPLGDVDASFRMKMRIQEALQQMANQNIIDIGQSAEGGKTYTADMFVQHFANKIYDPKEKKETSVDMDHPRIISSATDKVVGNSRTAIRMITVTDPFGGRGHDFDVTEDAVNDEHGMLVIATSIAGSRDWTQWKGRTARSGTSKQQLLVSHSFLSILLTFPSCLLSQQIVKGSLP